MDVTADAADQDLKAPCFNCRAEFQVGYSEFAEGELIGWLCCVAVGNGSTR